MLEDSGNKQEELDAKKIAENVEFMKRLVSGSDSSDSSD